MRRILGSMVLATAVLTAPASAAGTPAPGVTPPNTCPGSAKECVIEVTLTAVVLASEIERELLGITQGL